MAFEDLLDRLLPEGNVRNAIDQLLVTKRRSAEVADGPRIALISDYIDAELARHSNTPPLLTAGQGDANALDGLFRQMLTAHAPR